MTRGGPPWSIRDCFVNRVQTARAQEVVSRPLCPVHRLLGTAVPVPMDRLTPRVAFLAGLGGSSGSEGLVVAGGPSAGVLPNQAFGMQLKQHMRDIWRAP